MKEAEPKWIAELEAGLKRPDGPFKTLLELVDEQAKDESLWFIAETLPEAYLQEALRKLHGVIEFEAAKGED